MGIFDFLTGTMNQPGGYTPQPGDYTPPSPFSQGLSQFGTALSAASAPRLGGPPVTALSALSAAVPSAMQAYQGANARQNIASSLQSNDLNGAMNAMLLSPDPKMQELALTGKMSMLSPDNLIKMALFRKYAGGQGMDGATAPASQPPGALPQQPGQIPVYSGSAAPASGAAQPAGDAMTSDPLFALAFPNSANALINAEKAQQSSPQGVAAKTAATKAAETIAQNEQDIALGNQYLQNIGKALTPDPALGGKSLNDVAPDGAGAHYKALWEGNAPNALGGNMQGAAAYNQLQSLLIPAAARQSKESFQRVTGMEFNKMLEAQGGLNQPAFARAAVFTQNMQTTAQNIAAKQAQNARLRQQYGLPPSSVDPAASAPQPPHPHQLSQKDRSNAILQAKSAIAQGKDPQAVRARLQKYGIDPTQAGL